MRTLVALLCLSAVAVGQEQSGPIRRETTNKPITKIKDLFATFPPECVTEKPEDVTPIQQRIAANWGKDMIATPFELDSPLTLKAINEGQAGDFYLILSADFKKGESPVKYWKKYNVAFVINGTDNETLKQAAKLKVGKTYKLSGKLRGIVLDQDFATVDLLEARILTD